MTTFCYKKVILNYILNKTKKDTDDIYVCH